MVDTDFERFLTREEFDLRIEEIKEVAREDVRRFINSHDQYLRENEYKITMLLQRVELAMTSFTQMITMQNDQNSRFRSDIDALIRRQTENEKAMIRVENQLQEILDSIYGNPARPDDDPSLMKVLRINFDKANREREAQAEKIDAQSEQIEELRLTIASYQRFFDRLNNGMDAIRNWVFKTASGRAASAFFFAIITGRATFPQEMDQIGEIIVAFIRLLFGIPHV